MKHTIVAGLLILTLFSACQNPLPSLNREVGPSSTLSLSVGNSGRTVLPGTLTPASYRLFGNGPSGATVGTLSSTTGAFTIPDLAYGSWTFTVGGWDSVTGGNEFLTGSTTINIASPTATASIALGAVVGANTPSTLVLNLDWTSSGRSIDSITGTLTPLGGGADIAINPFTITGFTATKSLGSIPAGSYVIKLTSKFGGTVVANTKVETVLLYRFQTTTWNATLQGTEFKSSERDITAFNFLRTDNVTLTTNGNVDVNTTVTAGASSIAITLPYGADKTTLTPTITVNAGATVSPVSGAPNQFGAGSATYTVTAADGSTKDYTVTVSVAPQPAITAFSIGSATGTISGTNIAVNVSAATDLSGTLVATFTTSAGATVKVGGTTQTSGSSANLFSSTVNYVVTDDFGSTARTFPVTVTKPEQIIYVTASSAATGYKAYKLSSAGIVTAVGSNSLPMIAQVPIVSDPQGTFAFAIESPGSPMKMDRILSPMALQQSQTEFTIDNTGRPPLFDSTGNYLYLIDGTTTTTTGDFVYYYRLDRNNFTLGSKFGSRSASEAVDNNLSDLVLSSAAPYAVSSRSNTNTVHLFSISAADGSWSNLGYGTPALGPVVGTEALYLNRGGTKVFALGGNGYVHSWNITSGGLTNPKSRLLTQEGGGALAFTGPSTAAPGKFAIHPNGKFAYFLVSASNKILRINIDTDGTMSQSASSETITGGSENPFSLEFNQAGTVAYVTGNASTNWVYVYSVDPDTGALTQIQYKMVGNHSKLDKSGKYFLATALGNGTYWLEVYQFLSDGSISNAIASEIDIGWSGLPGFLSVYEVK